jgi:hypothetical protein
MPAGQAAGDDVIDLLDREDRAIESLLAQFDSPEAHEDHIRRANLGLELRDRLAVQDAAKQELVHATLRDAGLEELAEEIDGRGRRRRELLARLDELTAGVSARDIHVSSGEEFDRTVLDLRDLVGADLEFERQRVIPRLREVLDPQELSDLGARVDKVRKRAPTHPKADTPLEHQGNRVTKRVRAVFDHLRDVPDAPHHNEDSAE